MKVENVTSHSPPTTRPSRNSRPHPPTKARKPVIHRLAVAQIKAKRKARVEEHRARKSDYYQAVNHEPGDLHRQSAGISVGMPAPAPRGVFAIKANSRSSWLSARIIRASRLLQSLISQILAVALSLLAARVISPETSFSPAPDSLFPGSVSRAAPDPRPVIARANI